MPRLLISRTLRYDLGVHDTIELDDVVLSSLYVPGPELSECGPNWGTLGTIEVLCEFQAPLSSNEAFMWVQLCSNDIKELLRTFAAETIGIDMGVIANWEISVPVYPAAKMTLKCYAATVREGRRLPEALRSLADAWDAWDALIAALTTPLCSRPRDAPSPS